MGTGFCAYRSNHALYDLQSNPILRARSVGRHCPAASRKCPIFERTISYQAENKDMPIWHDSCFYRQWRLAMLTICDEKMNDLAVVECKGRIVRSDAVFKLRDAVMAQAGARIDCVGSLGSERDRRRGAGNACLSAALGARTPHPIEAVLSFDDGDGRALCRSARRWILRLRPFMN